MNYLLSLSRHLKKSKLSSSINFIGLSIGIASFLVIINYVLYEFSYDKFHENYKEIYRIKGLQYKDGVLDFEEAISPGVLGPKIVENIPDVLYHVRFYRMWWGNIVNYKDKKLRNEDLAYFTDPEIFKVFSFPLIHGDPNTALANPNSVVITESFAKKCFGNESAMGKELVFNTIMGKCIAKITGVLKDIPQNSHLQFNMLLPFSTVYKLRGKEMFFNWRVQCVQTFVMLKENSSIPQVEANVKKIVAENYDPSKNGNTSFIYKLQPIKEIHLFSHLMYDTENGDAKKVYFFLMVGIIIMIITWINYINLAVESSSNRAKEIGIKKVIGCSKKQLIVQFLFESLAINLIPIILIIAVILIFTPFINQLFEHEIFLSVMNDWKTWGMLSLVFILGAIIAGFYPALILSSYDPINSLKGNTVHSNKLKLKNLFIFFQYVISLIVFIITILIINQVNYLQKIDLGINIDNTIVLRQPIMENDSILSNKFVVLKQSLLNYPEIIAVTTASKYPGKDVATRKPYRILNDNSKTNSVLCELPIDNSYIEFFQLKLLEGRNFSTNLNHEKNSIICNKKAIEYLGFHNVKDALNSYLVSGKHKFQIIGVLDNFHHQSSKYDYSPTVFVPSEKMCDFVFMKINNGDVPQTLQNIKMVWKKAFPDDTFDYFFLKDRYKLQYKTENNFKQIFLLLSIIAIILACMGQVGVSIHEVKRNIKSAGIRKIYCANTIQIFWALSKRNFYFQLVALIISWPISFYIIYSWLNNFASRINISIIPFFLATLLLLFINQLIIGYFILQVITNNPVTSLKEE